MPVSTPPGPGPPATGLGYRIGELQTLVRLSSTAEQDSRKAPGCDSKRERHLGFAVELARHIACPGLRSLVAGYGQRRAHLRNTVRIATPPARPSQMMEFYLAERYGIDWSDRPMRLSPETAVIGPQSRPGLSIHLSGVVDVFTIYFQPTGLYRLFGWPMPSLVDEGVELADLQPDARSLRGAIAAGNGFAERVVAAESWLMKASAAAAPASAVDDAARLLLRSGGIRIADLAARSELSLRQFERRFTAAVGLSPKLYGRTARLSRALVFKRRRPELGWAEVALAAGYADQAHLVRECTALAGAPPRRFMSQCFNNLPPPLG